MASSNSFGNVPTSLKFEHNPFEQSFASKSQHADPKDTQSHGLRPPDGGDIRQHPEGRTPTLPGIQELTSPGPGFTGSNVNRWQTDIRMGSMLGPPVQSFGGGPQPLPSPPVVVPPASVHAVPSSAATINPSGAESLPRNRSSESIAASSLYMMSSGNGSAVNQTRGTQVRDSSVDPGSQNESETSPGRISSRKRGSEALDSSTLTSDEKRRQFLERNRIAAVKCRQRKKQYVDDLKGKVNYLMTVNDELNIELNSLRSQMETLKGYIVSHNDIRTLPRPVVSIIEMMQRSHTNFNPISLLPPTSAPLSAPNTAVASPVIANAPRPIVKPADTASQRPT
ncbi:Transcription factor atf1 [Wickerhamiella sorbophila]|uniref:Transcription factor atf1 n=1 Tax=Wickerhamiella sorbophila TaxID=45607 RepID=A0A2T0FMV5_9ASCO|nr:Transcription factor atf1 [Wickerhamiella sorbophila]PRT56322.1 Transcription factor atf1 [Wickerhamiella sorbophila]